jgi:hypothetical protein
MGWGRQVYGIILGAGADVMVFRTDVLRNGRPLAAAATWEDVLDQAESLSRDRPGRPVLPPLPADDAELLHQFHLIAAGYDRQTVQSTGSATGTVVQHSSTFHYDLTTGTPRVRAESFVAALTLMKRLQPYRATGPGDVVEVIKAEKIPIAILTTAELGRLATAFGGRIPEAVSVAPTPGTRRFLDPVSHRLVPAKAGGNLATYLGDDGFVGAVRTACSSSAAAFDLLADLGGPATALNLVADPALGFGPWRREQTDATRRDVWNGYGLDPEQMSKLIAALKQPMTIENPVVAPRGPDVAAKMAVLAKQVRVCLAGPATPEAALADVEAEWKRIDTSYPPGDVLNWRREDAGLSAK